MTTNKVRIHCPRHNTSLILREEGETIPLIKLAELLAFLDDHRGEKLITCCDKTWESHPDNLNKNYAI